MRRSLAVAIPLFLASSLAATAVGSECVPTTTDANVDTGETGFGRFYVAVWRCPPHCDIVSCLLGNCGSDAEAWVYQEANFIDGLQRQDATWDDTCGGQIEPDLLIF